MAIMINPNAIQKGSITKEMLTQGARRPIILTSSTTEVDEETYQKLLSDDADVVFKTNDTNPNLCTLTYKIKGGGGTLNLYFTCFSLESTSIEDNYLYGYKVSINVTTPHKVTVGSLFEGGIFSFFSEGGFTNKSTLSPVLQEINLIGTDEERKAKLDQFEIDWKALTGASNLMGARFVGDVDTSEIGAGTVILQYNSNIGSYEGITFSDDSDIKMQYISVLPNTGSIRVTPLFSHLEPVEIFIDNSVASKQKNIDNLNAYKSNLSELGVDTNKSFQVPFREGDNTTFIGTLQYSVDTNTYIGVGCSSDEDTARIIRISSTGESTITPLARADNLSRVIRDLGMYPELDPVPLNPEVTGKYINSEGKYVDASGWNVASIGAVSLGNTYLLNMVSSENMVLGVALFVSRVYKRDKEGNIIGTTLTPLFSAKNTSIPASGYVLFEAMDDYDEVLVCYKPALTTQMLVARWGFKASNATQLHNLRLIVDNKTDFEGIYELLTAGYALNLVGKGNGEPQAFMSRKTGGGNITDGSAVIKEVDGVQPIVWNQLVQKVTQIEATLNGITFYPQENGEVLITGVATENTYAATYHYLGYDYKSVANHKAFVQIFGDATRTMKLYVTDDRQVMTDLGIVQWGTVAAGGVLFIPKGYDCGQGVRLRFIVTDLTQMFGAGNEPSTYEEYLDRISHYHIKDAYAYNAGEVVNYKGTGIKTTNVDGTKTYVRDWSEVMRKYFPDGMTSLNGVKDFFNERKAVRRWGVKVFDGTEEWIYYTKYGDFHDFVVIIEDIVDDERPLLCNLYTNRRWTDKSIFSLPYYKHHNINVIDSAYDSVESWKAHLAELYAAGTPLVLYYELAEPVEDIFDKPLNLTYTVINGGTETSLATENSTQFEGSIAYNKDYVAVVDELQIQNRVTQIEFENWEN